MTIKPEMDLKMTLYYLQNCFLKYLNYLQMNINSQIVFLFMLQ